MIHKLLTHPAVILAGGFALALLVILTQDGQAPAPGSVIWI